MTEKYFNRLILLFLLTGALSVRGQSVTWTDQTSNVSLPPGVRFFSGEKNNPLLKAWYIDIDLHNADIAVRPYPYKPVSNW